ncbi:hypothetical protein H1P_860020 [Hyella patelloides LEGE 07179]|uniref:Uncharacterized protein n=1 Tax=Hyella patelloides LEGE 07179 TaxID=945734 RepID=A0A563W4T6_9CYAN|nr:hypothetical protein H1P_860020 [Hyella patelloides LEGE 07179]
MFWAKAQIRKAQRELLAWVLKAITQCQALPDRFFSNILNIK